MTDLSIDYEALANAIAQRMTINNPDDTTLWNGKDCAFYLRQAYVTFRDHTSKQETFPQAIRLPNGRGTRSNALWRAQDVIKWAQKY
jgi:hypothetical protein